MRKALFHAVSAVRVAPAAALALGVVLFASLGDARAASCDDPAGAPIASIDVTGTEAAREEPVRAALGVRPGDVVTPLSFAKLEDAVLALGWFDRASVVLTPAGDDRGCVLRVRVTELGPVREIRFEGRRAIPEESLRAVIRTAPGAPGNRRTAAEDAEAIAARYHEEGFEAARVLDVEVAPGTVVFRISEGTIARVEVRGARLTGRRRVRRVLGIAPGDVYSSKALIEGQTALYRTGLFSAVGFGVEPLPDDAEERLVLTVTVTEYRNPFSRTELFAGQGSGADGESRGLSGANVEARIRNVGAGHSLRAYADLLAPAPDDLAGAGFDEFYRIDARAEIAFFRPEESGGGALAGAGVERVHGRRRDDVSPGLELDVESPSLSAGVETPVLRSDAVAGFGGFSGTVGWREVHAREPGAVPGTAAERDLAARAWARGDVGIDLREAAGLGLSRSGLRVRAGIELHDGLEPFSFLAAAGRIGWHFAPGHRLEAAADAAVLSGDVPFWRETAIGGADGPYGYGREIAFARRHARGRVEYAASLPGGLFAAATGVSGAVWGGALGARGADDAESAHFELRLGPDFARARAGVAVPFPERDRDPWFYAGIVVATPY